MANAKEVTDETFEAEVVDGATPKPHLERELSAFLGA